VYGDDPDGLRTPVAPDPADLGPPPTTTPPPEEPVTVTTSDSPPGVAPLSVGTGTAANDTAGQTTRETNAAATAQAQLSTGTAEAVLLKPAAKDANGTPVPVTMSKSGSTVTTSVPHRAAGYVYPITVLSEIAAAGDDGGSGQELQAASTGDMKVMTWNIFHQGSQSHMNQVAFKIAEEHPHVVVLQEMCNGDSIDYLKAKLRREKYAMDVFFDWEYGHRCLGNGAAEGNAILSRHKYDLRYPKHHYMDATEREHYQRVLESADVSLAGHKMHVYNTHLNVHEPDIRHDQMNEVGGIAESWGVRNNDQTIFGGDFNEQAHSYWLTKYFSNRDHPLAYSAPTCGRTFDSEDYNNNCIDHWYVYQEGMNHGSSRIVPCKYCNGSIYKPYHPPAGSDHWPVVLNVSYKNP
jgi:endonuclease/exonuclease/phosphatase family metal-dependent hydrolase